MKKKNVIAFVLLLVFLINICFLIVPLISGRAQGEYTSLRLMMDNRMVDYKELSVYIKYNGNQIKTDVPPLVISDRVLVPVRAVFETVSGDLNWDQKNSIATINANGNIIKLTINKDIAIVNGNSVKLDTPAKLINERTFVPIRFIAENSGLNVSWDNNSRTVNIVDNNVAGARIESISSSLNERGDIYSVFINTNNNDFVFSREFLSDSRKLVMDFKNTTNNINEFLFYENKFLFNIRHSNFSNNPPTARVVFEIKPTVLYDIQDMNNGKRVDFIIKRGNISNVAVDGNSNVKISMTNGKTPTVLNMDNPKRLVLDFDDTDLTFNNSTIPVNNNVIKEVRVSKREQGVRIVIEYSNNNVKYALSNSATLVNIKNTLPGDNSNPPTTQGKCVVLDPGHGGSDPGAVGKEEGKPDLLEKDVNLKIALKAEQYLKNAGVTVYMTRRTDVAVGLKERADYANQKNASLFVSVHNNSSTSDKPSGTMTMYAYNDPKAGQVISDREFALVMQKHLVEGTQGKNYGPVQNEKLAVCWRTQMPAVITESLFLSNKEDRELLRNDWVLDNIARAIADGVIESLQLV